MVGVQRHGSQVRYESYLVRRALACELTVYMLLVLGGIISLRVMGQQIIVINDYKVAVDLLEKRSSVYSSRPASPLFKLYVRFPDDPAATDAF